ncbi:DUF4145 domain-containing protein [Gracilibacillus saliphilus]|uniref:DUF4145 domain-containing protein n=1 Tax=Gracilibacillus saliphilus TaxID=543890 RepID=UPI0013D1FE31|nr:DUF4145 domain-containing protein [Gracilibacillus saliphilus]
MERLGEKVYCAFCENKTNHGIIFTHERKSNTYDDFQWHEEHHIVQCLGCDNVAFVRQYGDEDIWDYDYKGERIWVDEFTVYPEEPRDNEEIDLTIDRKPIQFKSVPSNILDLYNQIVESFSNLHLVLCTSGLRTLIEGICSQQNIKKGYLYDDDKNKLPDPKDGVVRKQENLGGRIFGLYEEGYILFQQALILQKVKDLGNNAIHDIVTPDIYTINDIIEIAEKVMHDIYELKNHSLLQSGEPKKPYPN